MPESLKPPITDSPWFWVILFSVVGLVALFAIRGQYGKRQARLERQYQARERVMDNAATDPTRREYATPDSTLVPIWPLAAILVVTAIVASALLRRDLRRERHELSG